MKNVYSTVLRAAGEAHLRAFEYTAFGVSSPS